MTSSRSRLIGVLPSIVADAIWPERRTTWKVHRTSYLDGLRGLASMVVFVCHYTEENFPPLLPPYGHNKDGRPSSLIQLPFLRIIYSGRPMVHIFFVISGFALSYKPLQFIHSRNLEACYSTLASSAFRRPFRLFGPCVVSTLVIAASIQAGLLYTPMESTSAQAWAWLDAVFHSITWPWAWDQDLRPGYDVHLWSIPIEFVHSMLLFLAILAFSRLRQLVRLAAVFSLAVYFLACGRWAAFEFIGGMLLCELYLMQHDPAKTKAWELPDAPAYPRRCTFLASLRMLLHLSIIGGAMFIGGWPNRLASRTPGIRYLLAVTPDPFATMGGLEPQKFWFAISAALTVWSCGELGFIRRFLEGRFSQYCGRISYAVYIVHGPVLAMFQDLVLGYPFTPSGGEPGAPDFSPALAGSGIKGLVGQDGPFGVTLSWLIGMAVLGPMVIWAADIFWRVVDIPFVLAAKQAELACLDF